MEKNDTILSVMRKRLYELRKERHLSQKDLASKLQFSEPAYRKWERGQGLPETLNLIALAKFYDVSCDYLLGLSDVTGIGYKEVAEITGLSQASIATLHELHESEHRGSGQMALRAVNTLLEDQTHGFSVLRFIGEYIHGRFKYFSMPGTGVYQPTVLMTEFPVDGMGSASLVDIKRISSAATMTLIQECLHELRNKFHNEKGGA